MNPHLTLLKIIFVNIYDSYFFGERPSLLKSEAHCRKANTAIRLHEPSEKAMLKRGSVLYELRLFALNGGAFCINEFRIVPRYISSSIACASSVLFIRISYSKFP